MTKVKVYHRIGSSRGKQHTNGLYAYIWKCSRKRNGWRIKKQEQGMNGGSSPSNLPLWNTHFISFVLFTASLKIKCIVLSCRDCWTVYFHFLEYLIPSLPQKLLCGAISYFAKNTSAWFVVSNSTILGHRRHLKDETLPLLLIDLMIWSAAVRLHTRNGGCCCM